MIYAGDASVIDALDETTKANVLKNGYNDGSTYYTQIGESRYNYYWKKDNIQEPSKTNINDDNAAIGFMYGNRDGIIESTNQVGTSSWISTDTYYISEEYSYDVTTDMFSLKDAIPVLSSEMTTEYIGYYTYNKTDSATSDRRVFRITNISIEESEITVGYSMLRYGTTSKEKAQANINDSDVKIYLDDWYQTNLASYKSYISDTLFCNDRTIYNSIPSGYSNLGYGVELTAYRRYEGKGKSSLMCADKNDRFTIDEEIVGNGDLTNPLG